MPEQPLPHFVTLREKIKARLEEIRAPHFHEQVQQFSWLYGALGAVPSKTMFICENPSITGMRQANVHTIDDGMPDIEAQWWGGPRNPAAKRFRRVLCDSQMKETEPDIRGGWRCYITNVVKEANMAGDQARSSQSDRRKQARDWAEILRWELDAVKPKNIFAVGERAYKSIVYLQKKHVRLLPDFPVHRIIHYSARGFAEDIIEKMKQGIEAVTSRSKT